MKRWITEYANAADDGAPYAGPIIFADDIVGARVIADLVAGPNMEKLVVQGELIEQIDARKHGDTYSVIRRHEEQG